MPLLISHQTQVFIASYDVKSIAREKFNNFQHFSKILDLHSTLVLGINERFHGSCLSKEGTMYLLISNDLILIS